MIRLTLGWNPDGRLPDRSDVHTEAERVILTMLGDDQAYFEAALVNAVARLVPAQWLLWVTGLLPIRPIERTLQRAAGSIVPDALRALEQRGLVQRVERAGKPAWQRRRLPRTPMAPRPSA